MIDRQTLGNLVPLAAVVIALAEYLYDRTTPRYASPWFWAALVATVGLLVLVNVLRFTRSGSKTAGRRAEGDDRL
jgi:hypothetical protein